MQKPPKDNVNRFFRFIHERHQIYVKRRLGQPWPWTKDPILRDYKFCNIYREHDKTTIWIRKHWREPYADHPHLWLAMALARQVNWPPALQEIGFPKVWNPAKVLQIMRERMKRGEKTYSSAYMITGMLMGDLPGQSDKPYQTVYRVLQPLWENPPPLYRARTLEDAFHMFNRRPGFGPFLAYEVVTDLRHTRYLQDAKDIMTWANAGPGAIRGLHRIWGRPVWVDREKKRGTQKSAPAPLPTEQALKEMRYLLKISKEHLGDTLSLEMRDIEHSLCEYDRYDRVRLKQGTCERYKPPQESLI